LQLTSYDLETLRAYVTDNGNLDQHGELVSEPFPISPDKRLWVSGKKERPRRILATIKQVCGGVFTGHNANWEEAEDIVPMLLWMKQKLMPKVANHQSVDVSIGIFCMRVFSKFSKSSGSIST
jgi:hypothetical protein